MLSDLVEMSEARPDEQNTDNLNDIANVLVNVANFVNESSVQINETVGAYYCLWLAGIDTCHTRQVVRDVVEVLNSLTQWTPEMVTANTSSQ